MNSHGPVTFLSPEGQPAVVRDMARAIVRGFSPLGAHSVRFLRPWPWVAPEDGRSAVGLVAIAETLVRVVLALYPQEI